MPKQQRAIITREALVEAGSRVFARMHFEVARIADVLEEASVTQGAFYFHFPVGKKQLAEEIIRRQDEQFTEIRDHIARSGLDGLSCIFALSEALGKTLKSNHISQAGIRLVTQASTEFPSVAHLPNPAWLDAISAFLYQAKQEGNLREEVEISETSESLIYLFTGAQVSSFVNNSWADLPRALRKMQPLVLHSLAVDGFTPLHRT